MKSAFQISWRFYLATRFILLLLFVCVCGGEFVVVLCVWRRDCCCFASMGLILGFVALHVFVVLS